MDYNCKTVWCIVRTAVTVDPLYTLECARATKYNGMLNIIHPLSLYYTSTHSMSKC